MNNSIKKSMVILIGLAFLLSAFTVVSAESLESINILSTKDCSAKETASAIKTVTFYRYGPDGSVTPVKVDLNSKDGQNIDDTIASTCDQLFQNDAQMQNAMKTNNFSGACLIKSHGRGISFKTTFLGKLLLRFIQFRLGLPRISTILSKTLVLGLYNDSRAKTTITPLYDLTNRSITEGKQLVFAVNFIGYTTWIGHFSKSLGLLPRAFSGFAWLAGSIQLP